VTLAYIIIIVLTIGGMALFVTLDYVRKTRDHVRRARADPQAEVRLTPWLRHQHTVLAVLFIGLVYTGFVHRFPEEFFSWPFKVMPEGNAVRALLHRVFGWVFVAFFGVHLALLVGTGAGRGYARALWLAWHDLTDALNQLRYNVGLRRSPPPRRRWNYAEKAEYWALVWGSVVMAITGIMLVFSELMLRHLPKVWLDVAQIVHYLEAVLATLAIVVWHAYWAVFDPAEYPMNPAWLIGTRAGHAPVGGTPSRPLPSEDDAPPPVFPNTTE
jgi:cytochrome b subunit of formate dehydrogenase